MFHRSIAAAAALTISLSAPILAQDTAETEAAPEVTADTVVATVNDTDITLGHMIVLRDRLPEEYKSLPPDALFEGILDQLIQQTVLSGTVENPSRTIRLQMENDQRASLAAAAVASLLETAVTEESVQAAYDAKYADAEPAKEYNASHILVETQEEAAAIAEEVKGGADFAAVAQEKSTGPSGPNGGDLGWFSAGMMVAPFEEAVMSLESGQVSEPVETQFGWHVIKLNETRIQDAPPLEQVRGDLSAEIQSKAIEDAVTRLVEDAEVERTDLSEIDTSALADTGLLEN